MESLGVQFWEGRYESENTPWDLSGPSPHFVRLLKQSPALIKPGRMAVLGSGRGHDAACFAKAGFDVVGFDYAPSAIKFSTDLYGNECRFVQADVFALADPASEWAGTFDYALEHTCFCAILPEQRNAYGKTVRNLLKPGGQLIGIFWEHTDTDGPPFSTTEAQVRAEFEPDFEVIHIEPANAVSGRSGVERLVILRKK